MPFFECAAVRIARAGLSEELSFFDCSAGGIRDTLQNTERASSLGTAGALNGVNRV
jgi:hypothetical protein